MMNQGGKSVRNRGSQASSNLISLGYTAPISFYYHHPTFVIKYFRWDPVKITDKRTDLWSREFIIWKINFGLWAVCLGWTVE